MMYDFVVIGGGIVGVSTALQLQIRYPDKSVLLLEKEDDVSCHQTGHNSGVIHAGVYYEPGSLKAELCKIGNAETVQFCRKNAIPFERCGKLLVATDDIEVSRMYSLVERCRRNNISTELWDAAQLQDAEPNIVGKGAILVRDTAIVDFRQVAQVMADHFRQLGGSVLFDHEVRSIQETGDAVNLQCLAGEKEQRDLSAKFLVACAGLMADRIALMQGLKIDFRIIPYRGEYYRLSPRHSSIVQHLIYPIPDPDLPFLGIHLTRMIDGGVTVGPNAVQGWKREGYGRININLRDVIDIVSFPGFWRATAAHFRTGLREVRNSLSKRKYLQQVRKYCPKLELKDLHPYPAGVRAQAVLTDGTLVHDFLFSQSKRSLHVCNAPSPAATSAIPIGKKIVQHIEELVQQC